MEKSCKDKGIRVEEGKKAKSQSLRRKSIEKHLLCRLQSNDHSKNQGKHLYHGLLTNLLEKESISHIDFWFSHMLNPKSKEIRGEKW